MKFLDRVKNLFTEPEDPEDEIQIEQITRDGSKISVDTKPNVEPREQKVERVERERIVEIEQESRTRDLEEERIVEHVEPKVEEQIPVEQPVQVEKPKPTREQLKTPIFFTEDEFDDLEPERPKQPKVVEKRKPVEPVRPQVRKEEKKAPYSGTYTSTSILTKEKPTFKPTPIISPIYGILDKNYSKDDIVERKDSKERNNNVTRNDKFDQVRNKAYGNKLENDLENTIYDKTETLKKQRVEKEIDLFDELEDETQNYNPKEEEVSLSDTTELARSVSEQEKNIRELDEVTMDLTKELDNLLLKRESYNQKKEELSSRNDDELLTENEVFNFIDSIYEDGKE